MSLDTTKKRLTEWTMQQLMNNAADHDVGPPYLAFGNAVWDSSGSQWVKLTGDSSGHLQVTTSVATIGDGRKTVTTAGTRVTLVASSTPCKKVDITSELDNTGVIVVGGSTVVASLSTRRGTPLLPGDTHSLEIDDLQDVYLDSTVNGEGVTFTYFN